ncbi:MAG: hypothetical protein Q9174_007255, partial [Haloplaca sp. 1 TL-2023]
LPGEEKNNGRDQVTMNGNGNGTMNETKQEGKTETKINDGVASDDVPIKNLTTNGHVRDEADGDDRSKQLAEANAVTKEVYERINAGGEIFLTSTMIKDMYTIRVVSANEQTDEAHLRKAFEILVRTTEEVVGERGRRRWFYSCAETRKNIRATIAFDVSTHVSTPIMFRRPPDGWQTIERMLVQQAAACLFGVATIVQALPPAINPPAGYENLVLPNSVETAPVNQVNGTNPLDAEVCTESSTCGDRGRRIWAQLIATISQPNPVDRTDGKAKFDTYYGSELGGFWDDFRQLHGDLKTHGFKETNLYGWTTFSKDPTTGAETEDTAYKNYIDTFEGAIVA